MDDLAEHDRAVAFESYPPRIVQLRLHAGESVPPHDHPGSVVVFHVLEGDVELTIDEETVVVETGDLVRFSGDHTVSPRAIRDSTALVTLVPLPTD